MYEKKTLLQENVQHSLQQPKVSLTNISRQKNNYLFKKKTKSKRGYKLTMFLSLSVCVDTERHNSRKSPPVVN